MNISKHKYNQEIADKLIQSVNNRLPKFIEISKTKNYKTLSKVSKLYLEQVALTIESSEHMQIKLMLKNALNAFFGYLQLKSSPGKEFSIDIDGKGPVMLKADENELPISGGEWKELFFLANILRNKPALEFLFTLKRESIVSYKVDDPYSKPDHIKLPFIFFEFLYSTGAGPDISFLENLQDLMKKTIPLSPNPAGYNMKTGLFVDKNIINSTHALFTNNEADFNKYLYAALEDHKAFWGQKRGLNKGESPLCDDPEGFISWPLTALAAMAHDKGFKIEVESDYIPKFMVEGNFSE